MIWFINPNKDIDIFEAVCYRIYRRFAVALGSNHGRVADVFSQLGFDDDFNNNVMAFGNWIINRHRQARIQTFIKILGLVPRSDSAGQSHFDYFQYESLRLFVRQSNHILITPQPVASTYPEITQEDLLAIQSRILEREGLSNGWIDFLIQRNMTRYTQPWQEEDIEKSVDSEIQATMNRYTQPWQREESEEDF